MSGNGILCVSEPDVVRIPEGITAPIDFCFCEYECDYIQTVLSGSDADIPDPDGSFQVFLKPDNGPEIELVNDDYGTLFELGTMAQNSKAGYLVDWSKVAAQTGYYGLYEFRLVQNFFGQSLEKTTHKFYLRPYSPEAANGTIRIETIRNGCIEGGVDYSGLDWKTQIRIPGKITGEKEIETESYVNTSREEIQIQDKVIDTYTIKTKGVQSIVFEPLMSDGFMSNTILITDYNLFSYRDLRDISVRISEYPSQNEYSTTRYANFEIKFVEKTQNKIKRN